MNGIILTVDTLSLLTNTKEQNSQLIADLQMRIEEIRMTFNSQLPLYIVLTKLDLLRGFDSMYQSLMRNNKYWVFLSTLNLKKIGRRV